jgi:hypothetical protein
MGKVTRLTSLSLIFIPAIEANVVALNGDCLNSSTLSFSLKVKNYDTHRVIVNRLFSQ